MDYLAFTKMRTRFLRYFYAEAAMPFLEIRRKIDAYEEPFEGPPGYEDAEPPFLSEWQEAANALDVLGQAVASLLSQTLKVYVDHWIAELRQRAGDKQLATVGVGLPTDAVYRPAFKKGWLHGYREYCKNLGIDWAASSVNVDILEQLVLARNSVQHSDDITSVRARQTEADADRYPNGFFADAFDIMLNESMSRGSRFLRPPRLEISDDKLRHACDEVDAFCTWLDSQHPMRPKSARAS
jgi:hypothetical protein